MMKTTKTTNFFQAKKTRGIDKVLMGFITLFSLFLYLAPMQGR